jgi:hypothetical protein
MNKVGDDPNHIANAVINKKVPFLLFSNTGILPVNGYVPIGRLDLVLRYQ